MKPLTVLLFWSAPALAQQRPAADVGPQAAHSKRIEQDVAVIPLGNGELPKHFDVRGLMKILGVPGISVAVFDNYRILWSKGYGVAGPGSSTPVTPHTLFQAGDISQGVSAAATLALVEQGKLSLDKNVNDELRTWKLPDNELTKTEKVTLRRILSHTAGLTAPDFLGYPSGDHGAHANVGLIPTVQQLLDGEKPADTAPVRVKMVPGTKFQESQGGTTIEQVVVADATDKAFPEAMRDLVLHKTGMNESTFEQPLPAAQARLAARGTSLDGTPIAGGWHIYPDMAARGLWTTPTDLARFAIEIASSTKRRSNKVLSQKMAALMLEPQPEGRARCLGFFLNDSTNLATFSADGATDGFQAMLAANRETGRGIVIMANSDHGLDVAAYLVPAILKEFGWTGFPSPRVQAETIVRAIVSERNLDLALDWFRDLKASGTTRIGYGPYTLNRVGSLLLHNGDARGAIEILKRNTELYPQSSLAYDLLGEAYLNDGDTALAITSYEKAVEVNPRNDNAVQMLKKLRKP